MLRLQRSYTLKFFSLEFLKNQTNSLRPSLHQILLVVSALDRKGVKVRILINDPISKPAIKTLMDEGFDVVSKELSQEELLGNIKEYDALVVRSKTKVTAQVIQAGSKLKIIARAGVGLDNIDLNAARSKGIIVLNSPEAPSVSVAELVFGLMISAARSISIADASIKEGKWLKGSLSGFELRGKSLGIVGFGRIGREVAKRAIAFEMKVLAYDVLASSLASAKEIGVEPVGTDRSSFEKLIRTSDIITIHVPALPETNHMFGEKEFAMMKKNALVINASRGEVIDESALLKAISENRIGGAGLDVFEHEPPANLALVKSLKVVCTPHIGAQTAEAQEAAGEIISAKIIDAFKKKGFGGR
jgi:D-3-phosphoglycerate dehydrogenase